MIDWGNLMKTEYYRSLIALALLTLPTLNARAQGTAFTYQGRLDSGTNLANGTYDLTFALYNASTGSGQTGTTLTNLGVSVSNGEFSVTEDFGNVFTGTTFWMQIGVRTNGASSFTALSPRQELTPTPYAVYAESAGSNPLLADPGTQNFFAGLDAGNASSPGTYNTAIGFSALNINTGSYNSALGNDSLAANTTGDANTADGVFTLWKNTTGANNTAYGADAMAYNISGSQNTAVGQGALENNTNGSANTALGALALGNGVGADDDTAVGFEALENNSTGFQNTATGYGAMSANTTGNYNTANGVGALGQSSADTENAAFGTDALAFDNGGSYNTAMGASALGLNSTGNNNTAVGYGALTLNGKGDNNTAVGYEAEGGATGPSAANTALGGLSLNGLTTGYNNTAAGYQSLQNNTTGADNVSIGVATLQNISTSSQNTAVGTYAFQNMTAGTGNTGLGLYAGYDLNAGSNNIFIGSFGTGSDNNVIRIGSGQSDTYIAGKIHNPVCNQITITGGSDLAEPFDVTSPSPEIPQGSVVVIDEKNPGHLKVSDQPYDTRVAGVLSGANGIHPGIQMHQEGMLDGGKNVALTGRVYVQASASNGAINPGDLLTTSDIPGYAMKVSDHLRAQGAILGKAMTGLSQGKGMVLVLVTLQ
jgi:hypothetical protein